jgi:hypothetical protein
MGVYFADAGTVPADVEQLMEQIVLTAEEWWGYAPGQLLQKTTTDPRVTGQPGIVVQYNTGRTEGGLLGGQCQGTNIGVFNWAGTSGTAIIAAAIARTQGS